MILNAQKITMRNLLTALFTLLGFSLFAQMSGIYTVNPAAAASATNFQTIVAANTALQTNGISAPVTIQIFNGTYTEAGTTLGAVAGSSPTNTITYTSLTNDSLTVTLTRKFLFTGTSNVIIKNLRIDSLYIDGTVENYTINNNSLKFVETKSGNNIACLNNTFRARGVAYFASKSGSIIDNIRVENNVFVENVYLNTAGVGTTGHPYVVQWTQVRNPILKNNTFKSIAMINIGYGLIGCCSYFSYPFGSTFVFDKCSETAIIEGNKFENISTDRFFNDIDLLFTSNNTPRLTKMVMRNNFFNVTDQLGLLPYAVAGLPTEFYYNNVNNNGLKGVDLSSNLGLVQNNIFASTTAKVAATISATPTNFNYNDFYTNGLTLITVPAIPSPINYATLTAYQTASGTNANSINVDPKYYSASNLHTQHPALVAAGTPTPSVSPVLIDIDGDARNSLNPCIGADEFSPISNDVALLSTITATKDFAATSGTPLSIKIKNKGAAALNQVQINYSIDGVAQPPYAWSGSLVYDDSVVVNVGNVVYPMLKFSKLRVWTSLPNGAPDQIPADDSSGIINVIPYTNGTFTLGGAMPTFNNFAHADSILSRSGVDGAVNILIRDGKYIERVRFKNVRGASATNLITYKGENNNAALDTIAFNNTIAVSTYNPTTFAYDFTQSGSTILLDSAKFVKFQHITIQNLQAAANSTGCVEFYNKTSDITFDNCVFTGIVANPSPNTGAKLRMPNISLTAAEKPLGNFTFTNNLFTNGGSGIDLPLTNSIVRKNRFNKNYDFAIKADLTTTTPMFCHIDSNRVDTSSYCSFSFGGTCFGTATYSTRGFFLTGFNGGQNNDVRINSNQIFGEIQNNFPGTAAAPVKIYNNTINPQASTTALNLGAGFSEIDFNSIVVASNTAVSVATYTNVKLRNNIIISSTFPTTAPGFASSALVINTAALSTFTASNNRYFNDDSTKVINRQGTNISLGTFQTVNGKETNSGYLTGNPFVKLGSDLHIKNTSAAAVNLYGTGIPLSILTDMDDSTRNVTTPCVGADEFQLLAVDGGVSLVNTTSTPMPIGTNNLEVSVRNYGTSNLTSATLNWSVDGVVQTPAAWSGNLALGQIAANVPLGSFNFATSKAYTIKAWTIVGGDGNPANDTTTLTIRPALCGTYTVGGATPSFATLDSCINYLNLAGVTCATVINLRNGTYLPPSTSVSFVIGKINGASTTNTVTFQSENGDSSLVKLTHAFSSGSPIVELNKAQYVRLNKLTLESNSTNLSIVSGANNNVMSNCLFKITNTGGGTNISANGDSATTIQNSRLTGATNGIQLNQSKNATIHKNFITGMSGLSFSSYNAISVNNASPNLLISNNLIDSLAATTGNLVNGGIYVYNNGNTPITIINNIIRKRKSASSGIDLQFVGSTSTAMAAVLVANNTVHTEGGNGLNISSSGNTKIVHNNVLQTSTNVGAACLNFSGSSTTLKDSIRNNNFISTANDRAFFASGTNTTYFASHNNIRSNGVFKAYYNNTLYTTIASLQTASSMHAGTISKDPLYILNQDLRVAENTLNVAIPLSYITTDIDGETRSTTAPFIGADELVVTQNDAGITLLNAPVKPFAQGTQSVQATIRNFGAANLTSATINWSVDGVAQTPFTYTGNLASNATDLATIGTFNFATRSAGYVLKMWTSNPNGATDASNINDTLTVNNIYPALIGTYTIGGVAPTFTTFNAATQNLVGGGMLGDVVMNVRDGRYPEAVRMDSIPFQNNFTVTWQSEMGNNQNVQIAYAANVADNRLGVLEFSKAKNQIFKDMTVKLTRDFYLPWNSTVFHVVALLNKNKNIQLINNQIVDSSYYSFGSNPQIQSKLLSNVLLPLAQSFPDSLIFIQNNKFMQVKPAHTQGAAAVELFGNALNPSHQFTFTGNTFSIFSKDAPILKIGKVDVATISNNKIEGSVTLQKVDNLTFSNNDVYHEGYSRVALDIISETGRPANKPILLSNNMIQTKVVGFFNGNYVNNTAVKFTGDRIKFIHNTVVTSDTGFTTGYNYGAAIDITNSTRDTLVNNIIHNNTTGYLFLNNIPANSVSNNNLLFAKRINANANTLAEWKTYSSQDANSITGIDPYFRGVRDLHSSNILIKTLTADPSVSTDFDGQIRSATTCYGADEFTQPVNDAVIVDYAPRKIFPEGNNSVSVTIYNNGSASITSLQFAVGLKNYPQGTTTPTNVGNLSYNFSGNIAPGATQTISLGNLTIPIHRNQLKINNLSTNGVADEVPHTDTLQNDLYYAGLNGSYTFFNSFSGANSFNSFSLVNEQLKHGGVYGASTLNLVAGLHNGQLRLDSIPNRGALSPLTITSANNDSINTGIVNSSGQAVYISKASYVTLKKLKIQNTAGGLLYQVSMVQVQKSQNINIESCYLKNLNAGSNDYFSGGGINAIAVKGLTIKNNYFDTSAVGIVLTLNGFDSTTQVLIEKNIFNKQREAGIYSYWSRDISVENNQFYSNSPLYAIGQLNERYAGIYLYNNLDKSRIVGNKIHHAQDGIGIHTLYPANFNPDIDSIIIANNAITIGNSKDAYGMYLYAFNSVPQNKTFIVHNSINNLSSHADAVAFRLFSNHAKVQNNIFYNKNNGRAIDITKSGTFEQNYNLLYTGGTTLGKIDGINYTTLAAIGAIGVDYNSVTGDPLFISDTDLHTDGSIVNNKGVFTAVAFSPTDIDGETRNATTPDIGVDEFTLPDYGVVQLTDPLSSCSHTATEAIKVWVKNFGTTVRNAVPLAYQINGGTVVRDTAKISISANDSALFVFTQTVNLAPAINYNFKIWTEYRGDSLPNNDTLAVQVATTSASNVLPYYTGFEGTAAGWYTSGQNSSFKWGVVFSGSALVDSSANGLNAWKSNLTGPHNNNEMSYLYSPCFDLTSVTTDPTLAFNFSFQLQTNDDKAWIEMSSDGGASWSKLMAQSGATGWYNNGGGFWSGVKTQWHLVNNRLPISSLGDKSKVRLRFALQTNGTVVQDGIAIDDISIFTDAMNPSVSSGIYTGRTATSTGGSTFIPVNDPSGNRIVEINDNGQNLGTITVDVKPTVGGTPTLHNGQAYLGRSFVIKVQNPPVAPATVTVRLFITEAELNAWKALDPTVDIMRNVSLYKYSSNVLEDFDVTNNATIGGTVLSPAQLTKLPYMGGYMIEFQVSSFSEFWLTKAYGTVLPVDMLSFKATKKGNNAVQLDWATLNEEKLNRYEIERSLDGKNFEPIGFAKAMNSKAQYNYRYVDNNIPETAADVYYRLRIVQQDNSFKYSRIESVFMSNNPKIIFYPNPTTGAFSIKDNVVIREMHVINANGQVVKTLNPNSQEHDVSSLPPGIYIIKFTGDFGVITEKMMKQ
jgi:parallel beta-helix repeat protein